MGRTPAIQLAPGAWRIPTAPADLVNSCAFVDARVAVHGFDAAYVREAIRGFQRDRAGGQ